MISDSSQVVSIVKYLSALADAEHISAKRLWLPQIPALIYLEDLIHKYQWAAEPFELEPVIGEYDDPFNQSQGLLTIPFSRQGNALITVLRVAEKRPCSTPCWYVCSVRTALNS